MSALARALAKLPAAPKSEGKWPKRMCLTLIALLAMSAVLDLPITIAFDPNGQQCLPNLHVAVLVHYKPQVIEKNDYVYWRPFGPLAYIKQKFVLKQVTGVAGDHLVIANGFVKINGKVVSEGMALLDQNKVNPKIFEKDEIIPAGYVFTTGTHPLSNDSRYWGYLDTHAIQGKGFRIL